MNINVYQEKLMDHYKNPRNKKRIDNPDFSSGQQNPSCGDSILIEGKIRNNIIQDLGFDGSGCVISQAAASILLQNCKGKTIDEIFMLGQNDILEMLGFSLGPNRVKCATLSLQVLKAGLKKFKKD